MNSTEMIRRVDVATEARLYAVERCMTLMEKMIEDFEDLIVAYNQFSMYAGDEIHSCFDTTNKGRRCAQNKHFLMISYNYKGLL